MVQFSPFMGKTRKMELWDPHPPSLKVGVMVDFLCVCFGLLLQQACARKPLCFAKFPRQACLCHFPHVALPAQKAQKGPFHFSEVWEEPNQNPSGQKLLRTSGIHLPQIC